MSLAVWKVVKRAFELGGGRVASSAVWMAETMVDPLVLQLIAQWGGHLVYRTERKLAGLMVLTMDQSLDDPMERNLALRWSTQQLVSSLENRMEH